MRSRFVDFLLGYERSEAHFADSGIARADKKFTDMLIGGSASAAAIIKNPFAKFISTLTENIVCASTRAYGAMFLTFGVLTLLMNFASYYFSSLEVSSPFALAVGAIFSVISILLLLVDIPFADIFQRWNVTNALIFDVLCIKHVRQIKRDTRSPLIIPIIIGAALAAVSFFFSVTAVLAVLFIAVFVALSLASPEFSFMMTLLLLPALPMIPHSGSLLIALILLTTVSFIGKVILGKRLWHFEQYDCVILLFAIFILISGIFNKGLVSFESSLFMVVLTLGYFLTSNIIVNRRLADNAINIVIFSSIPTAVYALIYYFLSPAHPEWLDPMFGDTIPSRAEGTFGNPNIYAVYLLAVIVFSFGLIFTKSRKKLRGFYITALILNTAAMVLTWTRGAWLALLLGAISYLIIKSFRVPKLLLIPLFALPLAVLLVPEAVIERFSSIFNTQDSSIISRLSIWRSSLKMFYDNIFLGVGVGEGAFSEEFAKYAEDSVTAPHSHNLFLEIGCEVGIFALFLFVILLLIRIRHRASYTLYVNTSSVRSVCSVSAVALFVLLTFSLTDYIWYSSAMCFMFWFVFGLGSASLRIARKEQEEALHSASFGNREAAFADITITG
ncbi:MAG: O-antigen ligase family protein [Clostridia bacterium]|nr:O-antigen ligase family protein [Clostridia bacterium]